MPSPPPSFLLKSPSTPPLTPLPPTHPLAAELAALRQQVAQYRAAAHQAGIAVQGVRLELDLAREEAAGLRAKNKALEGEVEVLR
jgi:acetyl esterase/lipase